MDNLSINWQKNTIWMIKVTTQDNIDNICENTRTEFFSKHKVNDIDNNNFQKSSNSIKKNYLQWNWIE